MSWSLREDLMREEVGRKLLFRVIAEMDGGAVVAVMATGEERDAALQKICQFTPAWVMYKLLFGYGARAEHVQRVMMS